MVEFSTGGACGELGGVDARTCHGVPMRTFDPWDVRDPAAMIEAVVRGAGPVEGDVVVAVLGRGDDPNQRVVDQLVVHRGQLVDTYEGSEVLRENASRLVPQRQWADDRWEVPQFVLATVVCRTGRVVPGPEEIAWFTAWRYSNHLTNAFNGDVYLLTDHGWTGCADRRAGFTPALSGPIRHLSALRACEEPPRSPRRTG